VLGYIDIAKQEGAKLLLGGGAATRPECGQGWFVEPTVFAGVNNKMRIAQEEVFGPVLSVIKFRDEEEALAIANDVRFGLGSGVWTGDIGRDPHVRAHPGWHGLDQYLPRGELSFAVWRLQGLGLGARERDRRHARIPAGEKRMDQHRRCNGQPVRDALNAVIRRPDA
jgi:acyl-CoA reductase-like NAD-dependent aldehyde dehydrogenase